MALSLFIEDDESIHQIEIRHLSQLHFDGFQLPGQVHELEKGLNKDRVFHGAQHGVKLPRLAWLSQRVTVFMAALSQRLRSLRRQVILLGRRLISQTFVNMGVLLVHAVISFQIDTFVARLRSWSAEQLVPRLQFLPQTAGLMNRLPRFMLYVLVHLSLIEYVQILQLLWRLATS